MSDLISRADAINAIVNTGSKVAYRDASESTLFGSAFRQNEIIDIINALPSAEIPTTDEKHQLSSETPTNAPTDLIRRADAMGAVQDHFNADGFKGYDDGQQMMNRINALPSAEAVQGEWKRVETRTYKGECTNCGFRHIFMDGHDSQYRFCPYCGAKMTKDER